MLFLSHGDWNECCMDSGVIPGAFYIEANTNLYKRQKGSLLHITSSNKTYVSYSTLPTLAWESCGKWYETHTNSEAVTSVKLPTSGPESHKIRWQLLVSNRDHVFTWKNTKPKTWKSTWTYRKKRTNLDCVCHPITASLMQGRETLLCILSSNFQKIWLL
jgi:hypothetical protein